jgi:hypothetical protein
VPTDDGKIGIPPGFVLWTLLFPVFDFIWLKPAEEMEKTFSEGADPCLTAFT